MSKKIMDLGDLLNVGNDENAIENLKRGSGGNQGFPEDPTSYRGMFGDGGKKNFIKLYLLPSQYSKPETVRANESDKYFHIAKWYEHFFEEGTEKVREVCRKSLNVFRKDDGEYAKCPLCSYNDKYHPYVEGMSDAKRAERSKRKKKEKAFCNVYVIEDTLFPKNNGKVFKMRLNFELLKIVNTLIQGEMKDKDNESAGWAFEPENPFNPLDTRVLNIVAIPSEWNAKYPSYDDPNTKFLERGKMFDGDTKKILEVLGQTYDLFEEFIVPKFEDMKSVEDMSNVLKLVYGDEIPTPTTTATHTSDIPQFSQSDEKEQTPSEVPATEENDTGGIPEFSDGKERGVAEDTKQTEEKKEDKEWSFDGYMKERK